MPGIRFQILPANLLTDYCQAVTESRLRSYERLEDSELSVETFSFYTSVAAVYSSRIEGEDIELEKHIQTLREIREEDRLGPSTGSLVEEAEKRKIPWIRLNNRSLVQWK